MGTWTLIIIGTLSGALQGPPMQWDDDTLSTLIKVSGDVTLLRTGFQTEASCKIQSESSKHEHSFMINGFTATVKSAECKPPDAPKDGKELKS